MKLTTSWDSVRVERCIVEWQRLGGRDDDLDPRVACRTGRREPLGRLGRTDVVCPEPFHERGGQRS
jgi:hypothetical protein